MKTNVSRFRARNREYENTQKYIIRNISSRLVVQPKQCKTGEIYRSAGKQLNLTLRFAYYVRMNVRGNPY